MTGFDLLNTGKIYRKITKECLIKGIASDNVAQVAEVARGISMESLSDDDLHSEETARLAPQ